MYRFVVLVLELVLCSEVLVLVLEESLSIEL